MSSFPGPVPAYSNPPITPQYYNPSQFTITNITLGVNTTITTAVPMNYVIGQLVRLIIPTTYGCTQLNEQTGYVISIPEPTEVVVDIKSVGGDPFKSGLNPTPPQIIAVGDINSGALNPQGIAYETTFIPGSFINVSPL